MTYRVQGIPDSLFNYSPLSVPTVPPPQAAKPGRATGMYVPPEVENMLTPEQLSSLEETSGDRVLRVLATIGRMILPPVGSGAARALEDRQNERRQLVADAMATLQAQKGEARAGRQEALAERGVAVAEKGQAAQENYWQGMLEIEANKNYLELMKMQQTSNTALTKDNLDQLKFLNDLVKDRVDARIKTAVGQTTLGVKDKIPSLLLDAWWGEESENIANTYGVRQIITKSKLRARNLKEFVDPAKTSNVPYETALAKIIEKLKEKAISQTEAKDMIEYLDFLLKNPMERAFGGAETE